MRYVRVVNVELVVGVDRVVVLVMFGDVVFYYYKFKFYFRHPGRVELLRLLTADRFEVCPPYRRGSVWHSNPGPPGGSVLAYRSG